MAKRKPDPTTANQFDMFGSLTPAEAAPDLREPANQVPASDPAPANDSHSAQLVEPYRAPEEIAPDPEAVPAVAAAAFSPRQTRAPAVITTTTGWVDDEWWTLAMVCAYLKLGRKAVWERKRDPRLGFPQPVCLGSSRPRWRGGEVRAWAGAQN